MGTRSGVTGGLTALLADVPADRGGALWRLTAEDRQLDANVIRLPSGAGVPEHVEPSLDVLLYVAWGGGTLRTDAGEEPLEPGSLVWLGRGTPRALTAGPEGMAYLTAHRRRPGLAVGRPTAAPAAAPACGACGHVPGEPQAAFCSRCGARLPGRG
ncbi:cupin domain-containing protein [Streptomyces sp. NPDC059740]|uniref:cupin domain-containing protein n=1 Tax=Streptomyces sp. NPDC059740 TaxID=3346926 RepID=UPI0036543973